MLALDRYLEFVFGLAVNFCAWLSIAFMDRCRSLRSSTYLCNMQKRKYADVILFSCYMSAFERLEVDYI